DAANIVEGSQGFVWAEHREEGLYFAVTLPHLIVGTVGNGKHLPYIEEAMARMGIGQTSEPGADSRRLASLIAASVLAGELSLLAAQTNPGELMQAHVAYERPEA
ncbi:MAG: hydroxymethylglutaryl-CoA reductase, partial [Yaniella sp.]|nr:hydroxymethylglutaryl-CoA reductase [Yaniella sp.]